jgi:tRNA pseudouridine55 synthase
VNDHPPSSGFLNLYKPGGITSHDVVALVRRCTGIRQVGHAGTLDPIAQGVLVLGIGKATRMLEYVSSSRKSYEAHALMGVTTDTYDLDGTAINNQPVPETLSQTQLESICNEFRGALEQIPPPYSAIKVRGKSAYKYARQGQEIFLPPRSIMIHQLTIQSFNSPMFSISVECSAGTYIRSLIHDIGQRIGCGAVMSNLVRTASGGFTSKAATSIADFENAASSDYWRDYLIPPMIALSDLATVELEGKTLDDVVRGRKIPIATITSDVVKGCTRNGQVAAILKRTADREHLQPIKVFLEPDSVAPLPHQA